MPGPRSSRPDALAALAPSRTYHWPDGARLESRWAGGLPCGVGRLTGADGGRGRLVALEAAGPGGGAGGARGEWAWRAAEAEGDREAWRAAELDCLDAVERARVAAARSLEGPAGP